MCGQVAGSLMQLQEIRLYDQAGALLDVKALVNGGAASISAPGGASPNSHGMENLFDSDVSECLCHYNDYAEPRNMMPAMSCVACAEPGCGCVAPGAFQSLRALAGLPTSECVTCAASYYADPDPNPAGFGCKGCASSEMTGVGCDCPSGFSKMGGSCIPNTAPTPSPTASRAAFSGTAIVSVPPTHTHHAHHTHTHTSVS